MPINHTGYINHFITAPKLGFPYTDDHGNPKNCVPAPVKILELSERQKALLKSYRERRGLWEAEKYYEERQKN
jgi:hypothetical protein